MDSSFEIASLVAGLAIIALGVVLLLHSSGVFELSFGVFAPVACAATGGDPVGARPDEERVTAPVRDRSSAWLGGVCAGISRRYGIDVSLVRFAFVVFAAAGGLGFAAYALGWLVILAAAAWKAPADPHRARGSRGRARHRPAPAERATHLPRAGTVVFDALVWPLVLVASGGADLAPVRRAPDARGIAARPPARRARSRGGRPEPVRSGRPAAAPPRRSRAQGLRDLARDRRFVFLQTTGALGAARDVLLAVIAAVVVLGVTSRPG